MFSAPKNHCSCLPTMQAFVGVSDRNSIAHQRPVIGRLVFDDELSRASGKDSLIAVTRSDVRNYTESTDIVGIVRISDSSFCPHVSDKLPILTVSELPNSCNGKIALLDPKGQTLFVSPDIVTVDRYAKKLNSPPLSDEMSPIIRLSGKRLRIHQQIQGISDISPSAEGFLANISPQNTEYIEDELYERYRDLAESATGLPITATIGLDEHFPHKLRAIFRAAVYGSFSVLINGILTDTELRSALKMSHGVFCELEADGREFNGYIPRGICIDSPFLLCRGIDIDGIDFITVDAERIFSLTTGDRRLIGNDIAEAVASDIVGLLRSISGVRYSVILGKRTVDQCFCSSILKSEISEIIVPQKHLKSAHNIFKQLAEY